MRQLVRGALLLALLLVPAASFANHYSDLYVIPVASHVNGINGTMWMSDVAIQNFSASPLNIQIFAIQAGNGITDNVFPIEGTNGFMSIPAGGSVLIKDILNNFNGMSASTAALLVGGDAPFAVTSRSYSSTPAGDTVGQTVLPVANFIDNTLGTTNNAGATAYLPGVIQNSRFRSNLGFVAGTASDATSPMTVEFTAKGADGQTLGTKTFSIPAGLFQQLQFPFTQLTTSSVDIAGVTVRITSGNGAVLPYASVIDNVTADAVYVSGQFPPNSPAAKMGEGVNAFRALFAKLATH
jgi:hypothetical protein